MFVSWRFIERLPYRGSPSEVAAEIRAEAAEFIENRQAALRRLFLSVLARKTQATLEPSCKR
jgi:hypothetical protein